MESKLVSKLITGLGIAASLTTSGVAGWKVLANINTNQEVPEVASPLPTPTPDLIQKSEKNESEPVATATTAPIIAPASPLPSRLPAMQPSASPTSSKFPVASAIINGKFNDDNDDELEVEDEHEDEEGEEDEQDD